MFFSRENEPDLGDEQYGSCYNRDDYYGKSYTPSYRYEFLTLEDLVSSDVFQTQLKMALAHKDREIASLRDEILKLYGWR